MKLMLKILITLIAIAMLVVFIIPLTRGVVNCGNVTGITVAVLMILGVIFYDKIGEACSSSRPVRVGFTVLGALIAVIAVLAVMTTVSIFHGSYTEPKADSVVIVLGCEVKKGNKPSLMLGRRIKAAASYLEEHPDSLCIVSGGKGGGTISEAECMKRELIKLGISEDRIYKEELSTSTKENLEFSKKILQDIAPDAPVAIVTNEFHQYRAGMICDSLDIKHGSVPSKTSWWLLPTYYVREMYAVLNDWIGGPVNA